ncbi:hypothetical protein SK128_017593 [Halocaridina rubra]|uniref:Uncharacterized protein n=1 Tax=Halocaridina rubra TaxID=373956 RepID=A0AAN8X8A3_HALRR
MIKKATCFPGPKQLAIICCLAATVLGRPEEAHPGYGYPAPEHPLTYNAPVHHEKGMPFDFEYSVKDDYKGLDFGHKSNSDGKLVNGEYRVVLPDGRTQIVTYTADHYKGYQAEVKYEGEAKYPEPKPYHPAPVYGPPPPAYHIPEQTYEEPAPSYGTPAPTYGAPEE